MKRTSLLLQFFNQNIMSNVIQYVLFSFYVISLWGLLYLQRGELVMDRPGSAMVACFSVELSSGKASQSALRDNYWGVRVPVALKDYETNTMNDV